MKSSKSQTKSSSRLSVSSTTPIKKLVTTATNTKPKPKATQKSLLSSNKDSKVTTTSSKVSTTKNLSSSSKASSTKTSTTSSTKTSPKDTKSSRSSLFKSSSTTVKKKSKEKQEHVNEISTNLPILENEVKSPIRTEINSVMNELEKFRSSLHELSRVQEKHNEKISSPRSSVLLQNEIMMQAVQNQLSVVRQHITSIMDNYESDENLLTVIMTYNEEVNIALQEALQEVPKLYQSQLKPPPSPSLSFSSQLSQFSSLNEFNSTNDPQQIIEAQKIQIQFLEKANFNNVFQLINDIERCQLNLERFAKLKRQEELSDLEINLDLIESKILLRKYDIKIDLDKLYEKNKNYSKVLINQVLQRLLLETVLEHSNIYFTGSLENFKASNLSNLSSISSITNNESNENNQQQITRINPEVYAVLGSNGFDGFEHPFIEFVGEKLIDIIEKYFDIKHNSIYVENRQKFINLANELVHDIINVFYFRMQSHEPSVRYQWVENGKELNLEIMSIVNYNTYYNNFSLPGDYVNEEEFDVVGICSFPIIGKKSENQDKLEVYTKAKVLPHKIRF